MTEVGAFPFRTVDAGEVLYRVHRTHRGPIFYSSTTSPGEGGRFDLPHSSGAGTCYLATSALGACVETFGRLRVVADRLVAAGR